MSSEHAPTVVPSGISDPVQLARAELKAALAAIEQKSNFPRRAEEAANRAVENAKALAARRPAVALVGIIALAASAGTAVWGIARIASRR
ncbi:hypothetical protein [Microbacterium amylolyticum]|uniref:DUF3618 domain-containing protein n=1 Tax=Microbacterium amylolyticum TaxID=936337 RepID=A0ABS4ZHD1_9MICO|nr:hypothetical protein [Microbacterium amylolyticum]MBP2436690.1 hypothetical protein [Microbacterium amylolyticum]